MTFRNYLCNIKLTLKSVMQMKYIMIIHLLILFLSTTLPAMLMHSDYNSDGWLSEWETGEIVEFLSGRSGFLMLIIPIAAFVITYFAFSHLYHKRSAVFYGSIPKKRSCIYLSQYVASVMAAVLPFAVISIVNFAFLNACRLDFSLADFCGRTAFIILQYAALVSLLSFAASVSGNVFAQLITTGFVFLVYPVTMALLSGVISAGFVTYQMPLRLDEGYILPWFKLVSDTIEIKYVVFTVIAAVIFTAVGLLAYVKRKNENSELFFGYRFINVFVKYYVSFVAAIGGGLVIGSIGNNGLVATYIGCLFFGFLVFCIIQGIFEKSFKAMFANLKGFAVLGVLSVVLITIPVLDPFGFDSSVPPLKSVIISPVDSYNGYYGNEKNGVELKSSENLAAAEKVMKKGIENSLEANRLSEMGVNYYDTQLFTNTHHMSFYVNKNMLGITRELFWVPNDAFLEFAEVVYDSEEYKNGYIDLILKSENSGFNISKGQYYDVISTYDDNHKHMKIMNELKSMLAEDIRKSTFADIKESPVFCDVDFYGEEYVNARVYSCFENTVKYLKEHLLVNRIDSFKGKSLRLTWTCMDDSEELYVTDRAQIEEILEKAAYTINNLFDQTGKIYSVFGVDDGSYLGEIPENLLPKAN